jgi:hypothetical protein
MAVGALHPGFLDVRGMGEPKRLLGFGDGQRHEHE